MSTIFSFALWIKHLVEKNVYRNESSDEREEEGKKVKEFIVLHQMEEFGFV